MKPPYLSFSRLFLIIILIPLFLLSACGSEERRNYFKGYFTEAARDNPNSQRIFNIWFAGDRQAYTKDIYIGGNKNESEKYFDAVTDMLAGYERAQNANLPFLFEIVVDEVTYQSELAALTRLKKIYPKTFKVTLLSSIPSHNLPPHHIIDHAKVGNPAIASDALRIWYLQDKKYATNVYLDIDHFMDKVENYERYKDYKIFGREVEPGYLYFPPRNNDYLIDKSAPPQKLSNIKDRGIIAYDANEELFSHYKNRARFVSMPEPQGLLAYKGNLEALVNYQIAHPTKIINLVSAIINNSLGPSLWVNSASGPDPDAKVNPAMKDAIVSAQSWKQGQSIPVDPKPLSVSSLDQLAIIKAAKDKSDVAAENLLTKIVLRLNLLGWDQSYFSKFPDKSLSIKVAQFIKSEWEVAENTLTALGASTTEIREELERTTGGLYLSFAAMANP